MPNQAVVSEVLRLRSQNLTNDQIVQRLLYQGYSNADIFDALTQANTTSAVADVGAGFSQGSAGYPSYPSHESQAVDTSRIEEIAESIIEEKWSELVDQVSKIVEWKATVELKLGSIEDQIKMMKSDFDTLSKGVLGRIGETDTVMREVSTDIKALEQVFKRILPGFVENVNELSRITQSLKKK